MRRSSAAAPAVLLTGFGLSLASAQAWSLELQATLDHRSEYTTNSGRAENDQVEEWVHSPGVTVTAAESTATLDLDADYRYRRRIYTDSDFSNEDLTTGSANLVWQAVPGRLEFFSRNTSSVSTENAAAPDNPDNRQVVSNSTIGSTLQFQPRRGDTFALTYAYDIDTRDKTNDDSRSHSGSASYALGLSTNRTITLLGSYSDNSYDNRPDATSTTGTLGYAETRADFDFDVSAGYSSFDRDGGDKVQGGVYNAMVTWNRSPDSSVSLRASRNISDQASTFAYGARPTYDDTLAENSGTNDAFTETRGELTINQTIGANAMTAAAFASKQDYDQSDYTNDRVGGSAGLTRRMTRNTSLTAFVSFTHSNYDDQNDEQDEWRTSLTMNHLVGRRLNLNWGASFDNRDARTTDSYDEWRFWVGLNYVLFGVR